MHVAIIFCIFVSWYLHLSLRVCLNQEIRIWGHLDPQQLDFAKGWIDVSGDPLAQVDASWWKCDIPWVWAPPSNSDHQDSYIFSWGSLSKPLFAATTVDGWNPAITTWGYLRYIIYPSSFRVVYIPGGCLGFLPSRTTNKDCLPIALIFVWEWELPFVGMNANQKNRTLQLQSLNILHLLMIHVPSLRNWSLWPRRGSKLEPFKLLQ